MIGALILVSGLISAVFEPGRFIFSTILIAGGGAFLAFGILRHRQYRWVLSQMSDRRKLRFIGSHMHG